MLTTFPPGFILFFIYPSSWVYPAAILIISLYIGSFWMVDRPLKRNMKELLCVTEYARASGYSPATLRLHSVGRKAGR